MTDIKLIHGECLKAMKSYSDNHFDIAIVDPPYGIDFNMNAGKRKGQRDKHSRKDWDKSAPKKEYFNELFRVSKSQVIWGGNYFSLPLTGAWLFWDKQVPKGVSFADGELAWTSFSGTLKKVTIPYSGFVGAEVVRIHPTQKPVKLYNWVLENYTSEGDLILDTHLGSGSIAIACHYMRRNLVGYEIDQEYYNAACKRFKEQSAQASIW